MQILSPRQNEEYSSEKGMLLGLQQLDAFTTERAGKQEVNYSERASMTFLLGENNMEGDYRPHKMRQNLWRLLKS